MKRCPSIAAILALCMSCGPDETISGYAETSAIYRLESINGAPAPAFATISFPGEGTVSGSGPCNQYQAKQSAPYPWFELGPIAATRRACPDLAEEQIFFNVLATMTIAEVSGPFLLLTNENGDALAFQSD
ncbi:MAG: META domain-containing protein [Pseudomonadota bacterium]